MILTGNDCDNKNIDKFGLIFAEHKNRSSGSTDIETLSSKICHF